MSGKSEGGAGEITLGAIPQWVTIFPNFPSPIEEEPPTPSKGWRVWVDKETGCLMIKGSKGTVAKLADP